MQVTTTLERQFEQFRVSFSSRHVIVYEDTMVYKTPNGLSEKIANDANILIKKLKLPLVAIPSAIHPKNSFYIKSNETFDI